MSHLTYQSPLLYSLLRLQFRNLMKYHLKNIPHQLHSEDLFLILINTDFLLLCIPFFLQMNYYLFILERYLDFCFFIRCIYSCIIHYRYLSCSTITAKLTVIADLFSALCTIHNVSTFLLFSFFRTQNVHN